MKSKSALVIDTPDCCANCPLCHRETLDEYLCMPEKRTTGCDKPDWCPLVRLPGEMEGIGAYADGWNDLYDMIGGCDE